MSTRAELVAELHALVAYVGLDRADALERVADGTSALVISRMDAIARRLGKGDEPARTPVQCTARRDGLRCVLEQEHFGEHDFQLRPA